MKDKEFENEMNKGYDLINPDHYKTNKKEVWEMMIDIWGGEAFLNYCELCAFKYRMRMGHKPNQSAVHELKKALWYENKIKEIKNKLVDL